MSGAEPSAGARPAASSKRELPSVRHIIDRTPRKFDVTTLPADMLRVYQSLEAKFGEEYGLLFLFQMRTAMELHRAWHMTLLTSKILQTTKDKFNLRMTWNLGVIRLKFRVEDGGFELHRRVPYDYDSEYQDLYMRVSEALCAGHISVHEALIFQSEIKKGLHTAKSGLFLRDFPGRLILYPFLASTCAVIFFGGQWRDAGVAAICGVAAGVAEYILSTVGGEAKILIDVFAGFLTGVVGGLFYRFDGATYCLSAIFLGNLYWFFYGTAFVIGILEIIAGELETGVTRFMAVSIKTFVLSLMASLGMLATLPNPATVWVEQNQNCGLINLDAHWWRIPLYLACSMAALGQYRFRVVEYWRGLAVQLVGYEVQYKVTKFFEERKESERDYLDTMASNILGAATAVVTACIIAYVVDNVQKRYYSQLLQRGTHRDETSSKLDDCLYGTLTTKIRLFRCLRIGRKLESDKLVLEKKLRKQRLELDDPNNPLSSIHLNKEEENLLLDTIVNAESMNIWAMLMPTVYQLVPGSVIAKLWFNTIFPPEIKEVERTIVGTNYTYTTIEKDTLQDSVFSNLMVIATSLALGLIIGFAVVQSYNNIFTTLAWWETDEVKEGRQRQQNMRTGMYTMAKDDNDDPETEAEKLSIIEEEARGDNGGKETAMRDEEEPKEVTQQGID
eukprot:CAMPEP_0113579078 /NCGR_PEP_ID=MMETSP0015_2-20120614/29868_1 /TAXON_ID=2838 /ORGANISM="Odontella" /LENGTH=673 /DNA_ID=CAMNT_0000483017 /DNA_START=79 /DNA_END=2100 /DNA_ORIENTATION=- /assembly_acc=CAM_ASM_000160